MRTSYSQFEVMVDFMERFGDLNKPVDGPHGRLSNINKWDKLAGILNLDVSGSVRMAEKWKRVWSDLKNNTKRKTAKINKTARGTGGGPACRLVLTDLEQRVLNIMGPQSATGLLSIPDVGLPSVSQTQIVENVLIADTQNLQAESEEVIARPDNSGCITPLPMVTEEAGVTSPSVHHTISPPHRRLLSASPRRPRHSPFSEPRRRAQRRLLQRLSRSQRNDSAADHFAASDTEWRHLATEFVTENRRLRERELEQQSQWQILFARCLDIAERYLAAHLVIIIISIRVNISFQQWKAVCSEGEDLHCSMQHCAEIYGTRGRTATIKDFLPSVEQ